MLGGDLGDVPRRHRCAGAELLFGGNHTVGWEILTNAAHIRRGGVVLAVGSVGGITTDPTANRVNETIPDDSDSCRMLLS